MNKYPLFLLVLAFQRLILLSFFVALVLSACSSGSPEKESEGETDNEAAVDSLQIKIGQMLMVGFRGTEIDTGHWVMKDIKSGKIGGVILFDYDVEQKQHGRNIENPQQLKQLTTNLQRVSETLLWIAVDQEGGKVARLKPKYGFPKIPSPAFLGKPDTPMDTVLYYDSLMAVTLSQMGVNLNFAPVLDVNTNPENPVIGKLGRSFSNDPEQVFKRGATLIKAHHKEGVACAVKHFPGHGSSTADSHKGFTDVSTTWQRQELLPFQWIINRRLPDMVMTAHIFNSQLDSIYPATLSKATIDGLLRDTLGYKGVVISDDMQMKAIAQYYSLEEAVKLFINAGGDILLFGNNLSHEDEIVQQAHKIIRKYLDSGDLSIDRINQSYNRIMALKKGAVQFTERLHTVR